MPAGGIDTLIVAKVEERDITDEIRQTPLGKSLRRSSASRDRRLEANDKPFHQTNVAKIERQDRTGTGRRRQDRVLRLPNVNGGRIVSLSDHTATKNEGSRSHVRLLRRHLLTLGLIAFSGSHCLHTFELRGLISLRGNNGNQDECENRHDQNGCPIIGFAHDRPIDHQYPPP